MSRAVTEGIVVEVTPRYVPEASQPEKRQWAFAYEVRIVNEGTETVQLINRYWEITDGEGRRQTVRGPGVVGEQPVLRPGAEYRYASGCPLPTPVGTMQGHYEMRRLSDERRFKAEIAPFRLAVPGLIH